MSQQIIFTNNPTAELDGEITRITPSHVFVLVDTNTGKYVLPRIQESAKTLTNATIITIPDGDENKNLDTLTNIWQQLTAAQASRSSVLINIGGGVVTDIGGFAAATYKRGVHVINVPTTLLGAVDAAVGGKTGINFGGLKNQIGSFYPADTVIISTCFFTTLPREQILSGYGEMLKHALLDSENSINTLLHVSPVDDMTTLLTHLKSSIEVKQRIVATDPCEKGLRRALNLGHTIGHAFESLALQRKRPIPHGYAIAHGLVAEAVLAHILKGFPSSTLFALATYIREYYGTFALTCDDYPTLFTFMRQDKKNTDSAHINFSLLTAPGDVELNVNTDDEQIATALDIYRDLMGI